MMQTIALVVHVFLAIAVIGLVLIQHGKGAEAGAAFGSGASATVFGSRGSGSFLTRMTTLFALAFFCTSMLLFFLASQRNSTSRSIGSVVDGVDLPAVQQVDETDTPTTESITPSSEDVPVVPNTQNSGENSSESDVPTVPKSE